MGNFLPFKGRVAMGTVMGIASLVPHDPGATSRLEQAVFDQVADDEIRALPGRVPLGGYP